MKKKKPARRRPRTQKELLLDKVTTGTDWLIAEAAPVNDYPDFIVAWGGRVVFVKLQATKVDAAASRIERTGTKIIHERKAGAAFAALKDAFSSRQIRERCLHLVDETLTEMRTRLKVMLGEYA